ncbi:MAG: diaminopimelate epimerase [Pseudomonadota bacterium]
MHTLWSRDHQGCSFALAQPEGARQLNAMRAYAMNGAGNAFILLDARGEPSPPRPSTREVTDLHARHPFDQLIVLADGADNCLSLRFWNADGGEAGACGNGTRAAAWHVFEEGGPALLSFDSVGGPLTARRLASGEAEVDLGAPGLGWRDIPLSQAMDTRSLDYEVEADGVRLHAPGAVSMGNPHAVFFVEAVADLPLALLGPRVEQDRLFPERVNAGFAELRGSDQIRLRVWERGAGLTLACGTGACAALVAANRRGLAGREAQIEADGGLLSVRWDGADDAGHVFLSGPVELEAQLDPDVWR